jgi:hypothetical protein
MTIDGQGKCAGAVVAANDLGVVRRVTEGLEKLCFPYRIYEPAPSRVAEGPRGMVYCLGSRLAAELPSFPGPTIVILSGAQLTDEAVARLQGKRVCALHLATLTPTLLLRAIVVARSGSDVGCMAERLRGIPRLSRVPLALVTAFLEDPPAMTRLNDLRRALAPLSREGAQSLVRRAGFARAEHLFTALRCGAWALLQGQALNRAEVERYLAIGDRTSFRRACHRAGVPVLRSGLCTEAFDQVAPAPGL